MKIRDFIKQNRAELAGFIRSVCPNCKITNEEIRQWILNEESLYRWARHEGVKI